jgi:DnaJ-class molecular chaperone
MECPDCKGKGIKTRPETSEMDVKSHFPMLCDRCSGSGVVMAQVPKAEGQAVVAVP